MSDKNYYLCMDIGGTKVLGVVFDTNNEIVFEEKVKTGAQYGSENVENNIFEVLDKLYHFATKNGTAVSIAMGVPGIINKEVGEIIFSPNISWNNYPLRTKVLERYKLPCYLGNDVNLGILGECKYGHQKRFQNCVGIFVGTGIGGGIIINDKLYTGNGNWAGEFGHIVMEKNGPICGCGNRGCLESFAGKKGITDYVKKQIELGRTSILSDNMDGNGLVRGKYLRKALENHDEVAIEVMEQVALYLARGAGILINIFNPEAVIFGGGIIEATSKFILPQIIELIPNYCIPKIFEKTKIFKASLGDYSVVYGARAIIDEFMV